MVSKRRRVGLPDVDGFSCERSQRLRTFLVRKFELMQPNCPVLGHHFPRLIVSSVENARVHEWHETCSTADVRAAGPASGQPHNATTDCLFRG